MEEEILLLLCAEEEEDKLDVSVDEPWWLRAMSTTCCGSRFMLANKSAKAVMSV